MHRISRVGTKEANEKFISGNCQFGTNMDVADTGSATESDAASTSEQLLSSPTRPKHRKDDSAFGLQTGADKKTL